MYGVLNEYFRVEGTQRIASPYLSYLLLAGQWS